MGFHGMKWISLAQGTDKWRVVLTMVMNILAP
jgi:hypothetical protein